MLHQRQLEQTIFNRQLSETLSRETASFQTQLEDSNRRAHDLKESFSAAETKIKEVFVCVLGVCVCVSLSLTIKIQSCPPIIIKSKIIKMHPSHMTDD